jgi:hypothetical protein
VSNTESGSAQVAARGLRALALAPVEFVSIVIAHVLLPAWLHKGSDIRYLGPLSVGEEVQVRGRVGEAFERDGHRFVRLDVAWGAEGAVVGDGGQAAIWWLATS